jgi:hypothetical protein
VLNELGTEFAGQFSLRRLPLFLREGEPLVLDFLSTGLDMAKLDIFYGALMGGLQSFSLP